MAEKVIDGLNLFYAQCSCSRKSSFAQSIDEGLPGAL